MSKNTPEQPGNVPVAPDQNTPHPKEVGGRQGLEPTRYGDWEKNGKCVDF